MCKSRALHSHWGKCSMTKCSWHPPGTLLDFRWVPGTLLAPSWTSAGLLASSWHPPGMPRPNPPIAGCPTNNSKNSKSAKPIIQTKDRPSWIHPACRDSRGPQEIIQRVPNCPFSQPAQWKLHRRSMEAPQKLTRSPQEGTRRSPEASQTPPRGVQEGSETDAILSIGILAQA